MERSSTVALSVFLIAPLVYVAAPALFSSPLELGMRWNLIQQHEAAFFNPFFTPIAYLGDRFPTYGEYVTWQYKFLFEVGDD